MKFETLPSTNLYIYVYIHIICIIHVQLFEKMNLYKYVCGSKKLYIYIYVNLYIYISTL